MKTSSSQTPQRTDSRNAERDEQVPQRQPQRPRQIEQTVQAAGSNSRDSKDSPSRSRTEQTPSNQEQANTSTAQDIRETVAHEEIARRAHELWEQDGRQDGRDQQHWIEAEKQLRGSSFRGPADFERGDAHAEARAIKASAERRASGQTRN